MMESEAESEKSTIILILSLILWWRSRYRRWGVRPVNRLRREQGEFHNLFLEMKDRDPKHFFKYTRMDSANFDELLTLLKPRLRKRKTQTTLIPAQRLALTLRYLATGDQIHSIAWGYRVGRTTARKVILETCSALWDILSPIYLPRPQAEDWLKFSQEFWDVWNMPNCVGAIDGKHIAIQAPPNSGSLYYNYKKFHSIVLMAACDAKYRFTMVDVGGFGSDNDAGIFSKSDFGRAMERRNLDLPPPGQLPNSNKIFPQFFVGDEAFPLKDFLMRPYPGRELSEDRSVFNYRLSRARRTIENTFGIFASRWRVFRKPFLAHPDAVDKIVLASICLHNFIMKKEEILEESTRRYCPPTLVDTENITSGEVCPGNWRSEARGLQRNARFHAGNRAARDNLQLRDQLTEYLANEGAVEWQTAHVNRGRV